MTVTEEILDHPADYVLPGALQRINEDEAYLVAILQDRSGLDIAELVWVDEASPTMCYRAYPFQWSWWRCQDEKQIDQGARSLGKSESIIAQGCGFVFNFAGQEFLIVTPEGSHADALTERLEVRLFQSRLLSDMLQSGGGRRGVTHHPFQATFANGARIMVRLPQRSGIGVKGCATAGTLVLVRRRGLVAIETVEVGDEVWSHENRWTPVLETESFEDDVFEVRGPGSFPVSTNGHHRIWGRWDESKQPGKTRRALGQPTWAYVDDLAKLEDVFFHWAGPGAGAFAPEPLPTTSVGGLDLTSSDAWWLIGRWVADGYASSQRLKSEGRGRRRTHWVATPAQSPEITSRLERLGLRHRVVVRSHSSADVIEHCGGELSAWLTTNFGELAAGKRLPGFAFTLPEELRSELLAGYLSGDGSTSRPDRTTASSASKELVVGMGILAQGLGSCVGYSQVQPKQTHVMNVELKNTPQVAYRVNISQPGHGKAIDEDGYVSYKVRTVEPAGRAPVYNLVTGDSSYLANGIFHHNTHPVVLHLDEAQDLSERTWAETPEIVRTEVPGHQTRAHGVSRGVQDDSFFRKTQARSGWTVHRLTKMHRHDLAPYTFVNEQGEIDPFTTNDAEEAEEYARRHGYELRDNWRAVQAREYGGRESPDFKRNVYGLHGEAMNRIFVLTRLMRCVDTMEASEYNLDEYHRYLIKADAIAARAQSRTGQRHDEAVYDEDQASAIVEMVDLPKDHTSRYETFWCGMDVGVIGDPSELLVFAEYVPTAAELRRDDKRELAVPDKGMSRFKLVTRIQMQNVAPDLQAHLIMHVINHYRPKAFSLDRTGNGIGILRALQRLAGTARVYVMEEAESDDAMSVDETKKAKAKNAIAHIKGYNFGEKIVIEINEAIVEAKKLQHPKDILEQAGVRQHVKDAATDVLRELVDTRRLLLPYDGEVINQMNGQTWMSAQEPVDQYGRVRSIYSRGEFHILDAARMFALGMDKQPIEALIAAIDAPAKPVLDRFG